VWNTLCRALLIGAALCAAAAQADEQPGVVKLGAILSLSGPAAHMGNAELKTLQLYVERINAKGGVLTRKLILRHVDDGGDPRVAAELAQRFTERDNDKPTTPTSSSAAAAPRPASRSRRCWKKAGVPFLSLGSSSRIIDPPRRWVFKTPPTERGRGARAADGPEKTRLYAHRPARRGRRVRQGAREGAARPDRAQQPGRRTYGVSVESDQNYAPNDDDIAQKVAKLQGVTGLNAIVVFGLGQSPAAITRKIRDSGISLPVYHSYSVATDEFIKLAGKAAEGVRLPGPRIAVADLLPMRIRRSR